MYHLLNRREFEQTPGDGEGQGRRACCSPGGHKELDTTEQLNKSDTRGTCITRVIQMNTSIQKEWPLLLSEPGASHSIGAESEG